MHKRIWIELDKAESFEEAQEYCDLANIILERLTGIKHKSFYAVKNQKYTDTFYNYSSGPASGFTELDDRGVWLNLDRLAEDIKKTA